MKLNILLFLVFLGVVLSSSMPIKTTIDGAWKLVYTGDQSSGTSISEKDASGQVKFWADGCFTFAGTYITDTLVMHNYGWGTYKLSDGTHYEESIIKHNSFPEIEGTTIKMLIEIKNDTLIQRWPVDENWNLQKKYMIEKYIRLN